MTCTVPDCDNPARILCSRDDGKHASLCMQHYSQFRNEGLNMMTLAYLEPELTEDG